MPSEEKPKWWEIRDDGSWPGHWFPPTLYLSGPGLNRRPARRHDPRTADWRLRPHP